MSSSAATSRTSRAVAVLIATVSVASMLAFGMVVAPTASAAGGDWIAFTRDPTGGSASESGDEEVFAMRLDGTGSIQLTANTCADITPDASADGRWLAWVQKCGGVVDILIAPISYVGDQLTIGPATNVTAQLGYGADRWPQFSPDGSQLAFMRRTSGNFDIWRADLAVTDTGEHTISSAVRVVGLGGPEVEDCCVTWSPRGYWLVWASNVNRLQRSFDLYRIPSNATEVSDALSNLDGSLDGTLDVTIAEQLTSGVEYEGTPAYDADRTLLFRCNCPDPDIYRLYPAFGLRVRLTTDLGLDRTPEGYPGGVIYSRRDLLGGDEIYVADATGSNPRNLTNDPGSDVNPTWIPPQA